MLYLPLKPIPQEFPSDSGQVGVTDIAHLSQGSGTMLQSGDTSALIGSYFPLVLLLRYQESHDIFFFCTFLCKNAS